MESEHQGSPPDHHLLEAAASPSLTGIELSPAPALPPHSSPSHPHHPSNDLQRPLQPQPSSHPLPLPWSADDINPAPLHRTVSEWLPGSFMPRHPPGSCLPWPPSSLPPPPSTTPQHPKIIDIQKMKRAQLGAAARNHNSSFNISDPIAAVLDGVRERARLKDPFRSSYPFTLGGNPNQDEYSRAWQSVAKSGPDDGRRPQGARPTTVKAEGPRAAGAPPRPAAAAAAASQKVAYGSLSAEQQRFVSVLGAFLGVGVKLPLLAPGAQALDLKRLYMEVNALGGFRSCSSSGAWSQLASSLQNDSKLAPVLMQVYSYFLLPVEEGMSSEVVRPARLMEFLESKVRERESCPALPNSSKVSRALGSCSEELQRLSASSSSASASSSSAALDVVPRLALRLLRRLAQSTLQCAGGELRLETGLGLGQGQGAGLGAGVRGGSSTLEGEARAAHAASTSAAAQPGTDPQLPTAAAAAKQQLGGGAFDGSLGEQQRQPSAPAAAVTPSLAATAAPQPERVRGEGLALEAAAAGSPRGPGPGPAAAWPDTWGWNEVKPLEAFLFSMRQLRAGPPALRSAPPALKEHYLAQLRQGGDGEQGRAAAPAAREQWPSWHVELADKSSTRKRTNKGFVTPKCGNCKTCNNPSLKKACLTNRELLEAGKEPVFFTEEARRTGQQKKVKGEE